MSAPYNLPSVSLGNSQTSVALSGRYDRFERKSDRKDPNYQRPSFVPDDSNKYTNPRVDASPNISSGLRRRLLNSAESQKEKNYGLPYPQVPQESSSDSQFLRSSSSSSTTRTLDRVLESPVVGYYHPVTLTPTRQLSPRENAQNSPMIPISSLQELPEAIPRQDPYYKVQSPFSATSLSSVFPRPSDGLIPVVNSSRSSFSNGSGLVLTGDRLVFERVVQYSRNYFQFKSEGLIQALLRVYESPLTKDMRFSLITGGIRELEYNFEMPHGTGEIVLAYAYETSWPEMVYLQKPSGHETNDTLPPELRKIIWMCRFHSIDDLADFQSRMIGEDILLDISSVRTARVQTRRKEITNPGCRIQIWHERENTHRLPSDNSSYISNNTVLSGPTKEKTRPRSDRMLIFFNRLEEFLSVFNETELIQNHMSVTIKARRFTGRNAWRTKNTIKGYYRRRTSHAAGFPLGAAAGSHTEDDAREAFQSIVIEFEGQAALDSFTQTWNQSLKLRREYREALKSIQEEMGREQFTAKEARSIWFHSG